jgi:hypothetical protein
LSNDRLTGWLAVVVALGYGIVGVTHFAMPREQLHFGTGVSQAFFRSLAAGHVAFTVHYWSFALTSLLAMGVVLGLRPEPAGPTPPSLRLARVWALLVLALTAVDFLRLWTRALDLAERFATLSPTAQVSGSVLRPPRPDGESVGSEAQADSPPRSFETAADAIFSTRGDRIEVAMAARSKAEPKTRALWTCPKCGLKLVTRNLWHSCGRATLDDWKRRMGPRARAFYERFEQLIARCGSYHVSPAKTRITFLGRVRFAGITRLSEKGMTCGFAMPFALRSPRFAKVTEVAPGWWSHELRLSDPGELDGEIQGWLRRSYRLMGMQERLKTRAQTSRRRTGG